jgi:hypothetical protein
MRRLSRRSPAGAKADLIPRIHHQRATNTGVTWTYADGVVTITFLNDGDQIPFNVGVGGPALDNGV